MAPGNTDRRHAVAIAVTGASGALYATRAVAAPLARGVHVELVVSDPGRRLLRDELGEQASVDRLMLFLADTYGAGVNVGTMTIHGNRDLAPWTGQIAGPWSVVHALRIMDPRPRTGTQDQGRTKNQDPRTKDPV